MNEQQIAELKERVGYSGKSQQWQYGFDLACRELQAQLEADKWISVDERLPQCYQRVLCHRPDKFSVICKFVQGCVYHFRNVETGFVDDEVTHWQPLPEPPYHSKL